MNDFAQPFGEQRETQQAALGRAQSALANAEQAAAAWPAAQAEITGGVIPALYVWLRRLRRLRQPLALYPLYLRSARLLAYHGVTWRHPHAVRLRLANLALWLHIQYRRGLRWRRAQLARLAVWLYKHRRKLLWAAAGLVLFWMALLVLYAVTRIWLVLYMQLRQFLNTLFGS